MDSVIAEESNSYLGEQVSYPHHTFMNSSLIPLSSAGEEDLGDL